MRRWERIGGLRAAVVGIAGVVPPMCLGLASRAASPMTHCVEAACFAALALATLVLPRTLPALALPRHAGVALALLATAAGLGATGTLVAAAGSLTWAWAHRGALAEEPGRADEGRVLALLAGAAALGGAPSALWAAPVVIDGPRILEDVAFSSCSRWQRILVTRARGAFRLWLDGQLQVESEDERAYHESLVHPALAMAPGAERALVLGGGDGLVARELLRDPAIAKVVVVDLDAAVTALARAFGPLRALGGASLDDPRVEVVHDDALRWLPAAAARQETFDVVIADLPDPTSEVLAPLYAKETFDAMVRVLAPRGVIATQAGAPRTSPEAYACLLRTLQAAGLSVLGLAIDEPVAFGGTAVAFGARHALAAPRALRVAPVWLGPDRLAAGFASVDAEPTKDARITTLADPAVLHYLRASLRERLWAAA